MTSTPTTTATATAAIAVSVIAVACTATNRRAHPSTAAPRNTTPINDSKPSLLFLRRRLRRATRPTPSQQNCDFTVGTNLVKHAMRVGAGYDMNESLATRSAIECRADGVVLPGSRPIRRSSDLLATARRPPVQISHLALQH